MSNASADAFDYTDARLVASFWSKAAVGPADACWVWLAGRHKRGGYGQFNLRQNGLHRIEKAHRLSWRLAFGPIPQGALICHSCDVPACVNPAHLFVGSHADNNRDRDEKGRRVQARGVSNGGLLSDALVRKIRAAHLEHGMSTRELAARLGVSKSLIWSVVARKAWRHVV